MGSSLQFLPKWDTSLVDGGCMNEATGVYKFASVGELSETVTQMLSLGLHYRTSVGGTWDSRQQTGLEQMEQLILQQARDYLAEVREGFALSVRTTQVHQRSELRFLLDQVLVDWNAIWDELGFGDTGNVAERANQPVSSSDTRSSVEHGNFEREEVTPERIHHQLLAFGMAAVALGYLPRFPSEKVTFPHSYSKPATYADIPTPKTPGAVLSRIEELEQMVWRLMEGDLQGLVNRRYGALRRTYGFFEVNAHLARREAERFGIKPKESKLTLF